MKYIKTFESITNSKFNEWFKDSKVVNDDGSPRIFYHGTNNLFTKFDTKKSAMGGIIWFSTDENYIKNGESGAAGNKYIMKLYIMILYIMKLYNNESNSKRVVTYNIRI